MQTCREATIKECIQRIKDRPGRHAVKVLEAMLTQEPEKVTKLAAMHPWRKTIYPKEMRMPDLGTNPERRSK